MSENLSTKHERMRGPGSLAYFVRFWREVGPVLYVKNLIGGRKNCLELEFLPMFRTNQPMATGFKRDELKVFLRRCNQFREVEGGILPYVKTPEDSEACRRDWQKLIDEAQIQREEEQRKIQSPSLFSYFTADASAYRMRTYDLMIERFTEQLRTVEACQIERTEISVSNQESRDKWVVTRKNGRASDARFLYWVDKKKREKEPILYYYDDDVSFRYEVRGAKTRTLSEDENLVQKEISLMMIYDFMAKLEVVYEDGTTEAILL